MARPLKRLVPDDLRGLTDPPWDVLRQMREIDRTCELINVAPGIWWLGRCTMNELRMKRGARIVERHRQMAADGMQFDPRRAMLFILMAAGFAYVAEYRTSAPDSSIVDDFRERYWNLQHRLKSVVEEQQAISRGDKRTAEVEQRAREIVPLALEGFDHAQKAPVSIIKPTPKEVLTLGRHS